MIEIKDKKNCCGCWACVQRCPKQCISMHKDEEGFLYPVVDTAQCVNCGLCDKVCPMVSQANPREPLSVIAARNNDEKIRSQSSSGGIFTLLAEKVIAEGGVVFGARFNNNWEVIHDFTDSQKGISAFRGSKYVQSSTGDCFTKAEQLLKQGRQVLYSGTPCQIAGLRKFLKQEYENLITIDVICHGVPSPGVWIKYLNEETARLIRRRKWLWPFYNDEANIVGITFRDKVTGWKQYSFTLSLFNRRKYICYHWTREQNIYMQGFLNDLYLRPSCYHCPVKELKSGSDITIGDFWGIEHIMPYLDDDRGLCCLMLNTGRGKDFVKSIDAAKHEASYKDVARYNPSLFHSPRIPANRVKFFTELPKYGMLSTTQRLTREPFVKSFKNTIHKMLKIIRLR